MMDASTAEYRDRVDRVEGSVWSFPWPRDEIADYTALRVADAPIIDGHLDEAAWHRAPKSPRFRDLVSGASTRYEHGPRCCGTTTCSMSATGSRNQRTLTATLTERDSPVYTDNDIELFVAGSDAYYELEINASARSTRRCSYGQTRIPRVVAMATIPASRWAPPGCDRSTAWASFIPEAAVGLFAWDLPGLSAAVVVDGTLNDSSDADRGWTVELALPWAGLAPIAHGDGRSLAATR